MNKIELVTWTKKEGSSKSLLKLFRKNMNLSTCGFVIEENEKNIKIASSQNIAGYNDITEIEKNSIITRIVVSTQN